MSEWHGKIFYTDEEHRVRAFPAKDEAHHKATRTSQILSPFHIPMVAVNSSPPKPKAAIPTAFAKQKPYFANNESYKLPSVWEANQTAKNVPDTCYVANSSLGDIKIYGYGLFAKTDLHKGDFVTNYGGIKLANENDIRGSSSKYIITGMDHGTIRDARTVQNPSRDRGRWINDPHGSSRTANVIALESAAGTISIVADKEIKKGEELLMDYGSEYWK